MVICLSNEAANLPSFNYSFGSYSGVQKQICIFKKKKLQLELRQRLKVNTLSQQRGSHRKTNLRSKSHSFIMTASCLEYRIDAAGRTASFIMDYRIIGAHLKIIFSFSKTVNVKYLPALEVFLAAILKRNSGTLKLGTMFM